MSNQFNCKFHLATAVNMKWTTLLTFVLIGLVAGDGAWKEGQEYKYKLVTKTFVKLPGSDETIGVISRVNLIIRPQSSDVLIGQITRAGYVKVDQKDSEEPNSDSNNRETAFRDIPLNQQFKILLKNGAIRSLSVDRDMTSDQINFLKVIVSQFQVDTKAQNVMESEDNHLPDGNSNNAFFKTMEPTVYGECETIYDIAGLPDYLTQSDRELIPLPQLAREGEVIQVVKTKNFENCNERTRYLSDLFGMRDNTIYQMDNDLVASQKNRIVISGSLNDYTIQSAVTTNKVADLDEYIYLTLESVEKRNSNFNSESNTRSENLLNLVNLLYTYDSQKEARPANSFFNNARPKSNE